VLSGSFEEHHHDKCNEEWNHRHLSDRSISWGFFFGSIIGCFDIGSTFYNFCELCEFSVGVVVTTNAPPFVGLTFSKIRERDRSGFSFISSLLLKIGFFFVEEINSFFLLSLKVESWIDITGRFFYFSGFFFTRSLFRSRFTLFRNRFTLFRNRFTLFRNRFTLFRNRFFRGLFLNKLSKSEV